MPAPLAALALLLAAAPPPAIAAGADARTQAVCRRLGPPRPPAADRPTPAQARALRGCSSEALYYGEGAAPDYARARQCALTEADGGRRPDAGVFSGAAILMQIYANALGAHRDLDLATAYACEVDGAPAEVEGRVAHLQALKLRPSAKRFDYCDDITSGLAEGFCQARASEAAGRGRSRRLEADVARLPPTARPLYAPMKRAFDVFVEAHAGGEVDHSGTARAALELQEEDAVRDRFARDLRVLLSGAWPRGLDFGAADVALNSAYRQALSAPGGRDGFSTTKPQDVRVAQRAWLKWRDAFVRFARAAAPATPSDDVTARLSQQRAEQLAALAR